MTKQTDSKTKVENLGKMPRLRFPEFHEEWEEKNGNEIFKSISDKNHTSELPILAISQEHGAIPRDLIDYKITVTDKSISSYKVVRKGNFIISLRSFQGGIEYSEYDGICSPAYVILKSKIAISDYFFKYYLKTDRYILELNKKLEGIRDGKMISYGYFSEIKLPYPSLLEQKRIADLLSLIDKRIQCQRKIINQLETAMRIIREKIFKQQMRFTREKTQWKELKLDDFTDIKKGEQLNKEDLTEKGIYPCLNGGVNFSGYTDKYNTNANTITISEGGNSCGYVNFLTSNFWLGGHCYKIVPKSTINLIYFYHLLKFNEDKIMKLRVGSGLPNIQQKDLRNFKVSITVSSGEQTQIANSLASLDAKIETEKQLLEQYKQQKTYLLQNLFI